MFGVWELCSVFVPTILIFILLKVWKFSFCLFTFHGFQACICTKQYSTHTHKVYFALFRRLIAQIKMIWMQIHFLNKCIVYFKNLSDPYDLMSCNHWRNENLSTFKNFFSPVYFWSHIRFVLWNCTVCASCMSLYTMLMLWCDNFPCTQSILGYYWKSLIYHFALRQIALNDECAFFFSRRNTPHFSLAACFQMFHV